jgi:hypothetical protein
MKAKIVLLMLAVLIAMPLAFADTLTSCDGTYETSDASYILTGNITGTGHYSSLYKAAEKMVKIKMLYKPNLENQKNYLKIYQNYRKIYSFIEKGYRIY